MNASVTPGAEPEQDAREPRLDIYSASNAFSRRATSEVDDHHGDRHERERGRDRQVRPALVVDDGADELLARDQVGRDVVAERQREREDRAGDDRRERERQRSRGRNVRSERPPRSAEASSSELRDPLEPGVDRQDHERQPQVREDEPEPDVRVAVER